MRLRPRLRSRPNDELPAEDNVNDVGAEPSDEVNEVMTEPVLPIRDPEDESMNVSPLSLGG